METPHCVKDPLLKIALLIFLATHHPQNPRSVTLAILKDRDLLGDQPSRLRLKPPGLGGQLAGSAIISSDNIRVGQEIIFTRSIKVIEAGIHLSSLGNEEDRRGTGADVQGFKGALLGSTDLTAPIIGQPPIIEVKAAALGTQAVDMSDPQAHTMLCTIRIFIMVYLKGVRVRDRPAVS